MKAFFIRTPRYLWPFYSDRSGFWPPLAFASMAAVLQRAMPGLEVRIMDCVALRMGWKSLARVLRKEQPQVVCIGEETASTHEGLRLARLAKQVAPKAVVVAGGCHYGNLAAHTLDTGVVDFVVKGEGEITLCELIEQLARQNPRLRQVRGLAFKEDGRLVETAPRPLIDDLDTLPLPAYDLLAMNRYGRGARNHPDLVSVEHGRGCIDRCSFCVLWRQMGEARADGSVRPRYRTKSPQRSIEEVQLLARTFGRRTFCWVDPTWNVDAAWTDEFCSLVLRSGLRVQQTAWMRADCVVRDEENGVLEKQVRSGLRQAMIGVERIDAKGLSELGKHNNGLEVTARAFRIFREKYPEVYTIGTMIYGLPGETEHSIRALLDYEISSGMDYGMLIPLTPLPGTATCHEAHAMGKVDSADFRAYNFLTPVTDTEHFSTRQLQAFHAKVRAAGSLRRFARMARLCFSTRDKRRRSVHRALTKHGTAVVVRQLAQSLFNPSGPPLSYLRRPVWYES